MLSCAALAAAASAQVANPPDLEGLWAAQQRYGPDERGRLMILQRGDALIADIRGLTVPVKSNGGKLSFDLPDGRASFRGVRSDTAIEGQ